MFAGDFYPTHVDSLNETTGFKSNNQPKIYTSYKRALIGAMAIIKRSTFAVQILPIQEAGIVIGCPFRFLLIGKVVEEEFTGFMIYTEKEYPTIDK